MSNIIGLEYYSIEDIENIVANYIKFLEEFFYLEDLDFKIVNLEIFGSRINGIVYDNSDLDIKVFYIGTAREDDLFNALNYLESRLYIDDIDVDFFPVNLSE